MPAPSNQDLAILPIAGHCQNGGARLLAGFDNLPYRGEVMNGTANPDHHNQYDAIVVGAGPAGSTLAEALARASFRVALLEEHPQVGVPTHCSGLVSPRALEIAGVPPESVALGEYSQARVWGPSGGTLWLRSESVQAIAIERGRFDRALAQRAVAAGAELMLETRARHFLREGGQIAVRASTPSGERLFRAPLLVGADGASSRVARWMGPNGRHEVIPAIKADVTFTRGGTGTIEILVGSNIAPGWFGWVIPLPGGRATTGMGAIRSPRDHFPAFLDLVRQRFGDFTLDSTHCAPIPLGPARDFVGDGVLLIGAAARQTKPTTGGGVYLGIRAAQLAAQAATCALAQAPALANARVAGSGALDHRALAAYEEAWHRLEGREVAVAHRLRTLYRRLSDRDLDWIIATAAQPWAQRLISRLGDIDFPAQLLSALLRDLPRTLLPIPAFRRSSVQTCPRSSVPTFERFDTERIDEPAASLTESLMASKGPTK
jgi:digeranylgeranylglycerophospholipid reductase